MFWEGAALCSCAWSVHLRDTAAQSNAQLEGDNDSMLFACKRAFLTKTTLLTCTQAGGDDAAVGATNAN